MNWTLSHIATLIHGELIGHDHEIHGFHFDSRKIKKGQLFIPLIAARDGHDFIAMAQENGAIASFIDRDHQHLIDHQQQQLSYIIVDNSLQALQQLTRAYRQSLNSNIIAITGSVGKTSTKESLITALRNQGFSYANPGNFNNHIGLPLSFVDMPDYSDFGIFEMGMNAAGEIDFLADMITPNIAIITKIAAVHLEFFKDITEIADAKGELLAHVMANGTAILPRDDVFFDHLANKVKPQCNIVSFGKHQDADYRLIGYRYERNMSFVDIRHGNDVHHIRWQLVGQHHAINLCAVMAAIGTLGLDMQQAADNMALLYPLTGRGKRIPITLDAGKQLHIIDESYNASQDSIEALIDMMALLKAPRKILILGDMLELGDDSANIHRDLSLKINDSDIDVVHCAGEMMQYCFDAIDAHKQGEYYHDSADMQQDFQINLLNYFYHDDMIAVKGSLGSKMQRIIDVFINDNQGNAKK